MKQELQQSIADQDKSECYSDKSMHLRAVPGKTESANGVVGSKLANVLSMCSPTQVNGYFEVFTISWGIRKRLTPHPKLIYASAVVRRHASYRT
jgi:hypothetical protein